MINPKKWTREQKERYFEIMCNIMSDEDYIPPSELSTEEMSFLCDSMNTFKDIIDHDTYVQDILEIKDIVKDIHMMLSRRLQSAEQK